MQNGMSDLSGAIASAQFLIGLDTGKVATALNLAASKYGWRVVPGLGR